MAKPALGKGFDALINQNLSRESLAAPQAGDVVHQLSHAAIIPSSLQPRAIFTPEQLAELVDSIKEHGIIQPLIVRKTQSGKYELIAGERRWRASGILGLSTVPAIIREASDKDVLELALIENLQRENLSPLEEAAGYMRLKTEFRMKQGDIAKRVGKSRAAVANSMRLLDLPQPVQDMLGNTFISVGHAKVLLSSKTRTSKSSLGATSSTRATPSARRRRLFRRCSTRRSRLPLKNRPPLNIRKISSILAKQFGTPVNISGQGSRGSIEITFSSKAEFIRILELLGQDEWPDSK